MILSIYLFFIAIGIGITTPLWFGQLFIPVRKLRKGAEWLDKATVDLPNTATLTIEKLRGHECLGDKLVVPHFLDGWTKDLEKKIINSLLYGGIIAGALNISVIVITQSKEIQSNNLSEIKVTITENWPLPAFFLVAFLQIISYLMLVSDQASKYSKTINKAKPVSISTLERIKNIFKK